MNDIARHRDEYTRTLLLRTLVECGENRTSLESLSQLELFDCVLEKCMWDAGQFMMFLMTLLITTNSDKELISARLERSEEERAKQDRLVRELESRLAASEREQSSLRHRLEMAYQHPGLEALRQFLVSCTCEPCLEDLLAAGIDSVDKLSDAARRRGALAKTGIHPDVISVIRLRLKKK